MLPQPVILANIILLFVSCNIFGPRPNFSMTPGRNGSMTQSAERTISKNKIFPAGDFRSMPMLLFPRDTGSFCDLNLPPLIALIEMTSAPKSAKTQAPRGPGPMPSISSTLKPESALMLLCWWCVVGRMDADKDRVTSFLVVVSRTSMNWSNSR